MMATHNHTPGPWHNGGEGRSIGRDEEMTFLFAATQKGVTKKEKLANVRLACAAPDLLAAAEEVERILDEAYPQPYVDDGGVLIENSEQFYIVQERLSQAIAKAKGNRRQENGGR